MLFTIKFFTGGPPLTRILAYVRASEGAHTYKFWLITVQKKRPKAFDFQYNLNCLTFKGQKWPKSRKTCVERDRFFSYAFSVTFFSLSHFSSGNFPDGTPCLSWLKIGPHISPTAKSVAQSSAKAQPKRKFPFCNRKQYRQNRWSKEQRPSFEKKQRFYK